MFHYTIVFLDGTQKDLIADEWKLSLDCTWFIFFIGSQEILRVKGDEIRLMERKAV